MRECLLECVEDTLREKAALKGIRAKAILRLKARAALKPVPCCNKYYDIHEYTFCPECGEEME